MEQVAQIFVICEIQYVYDPVTGETETVSRPLIESGFFMQEAAALLVCENLAAKLNAAFDRSSAATFYSVLSLMRAPVDKSEMESFEKDPVAVETFEAGSLATDFSQPLHGRTRIPELHAPKTGLKIEDTKNSKIHCIRDRRTMVIVENNFSTGDKIPYFWCDVAFCGADITGATVTLSENSSSYCKKCFKNITTDVKNETRVLASSDVIWSV